MNLFIFTPYHFHHISVEPVTAEFLQDNYEDLLVHDVSMTYAEKNKIPCLLIQTNSDLDLCRGIDKAALNDTVFNHQLQSGAFNQAIDINKVIAQKAGLPSVPRTILELACMLWKINKKKAFQHLFGIQTETLGITETRWNLYTAYMVFAGTETQASIPIAGLLEIITSVLRQTPFSHNIRLDSIPTSPQWMVGEFLSPTSKTHTSHIRVLSQFRDAQLNAASTYAEFLAQWMASRANQRTHHVVIPANTRHRKSFWLQLELARQVAIKVRVLCPNFVLWTDKPHKYTLLVNALNHVALSAQKCTNTKVVQQQVVVKARMLQPNFGTLSPLAFWVGGGTIHILDFTCRMLEAPEGIEGEYNYICENLPQPRPSQHKIDEWIKDEIQNKYQQTIFLIDGLQMAWNTQQLRRHINIRQFCCHVFIVICLLVAEIVR